jgi:predicted dehydrogenase
LFLLGSPVVSVSGTVNTFVTSRTGDAGPEEVTVDDAAWATLRLGSGAVASLEVSRFATGRKNSLEVEVFGSRGALRFDLEQLNELRFFDTAAPDEAQGYSRILVTERSHPYLDAWWPAGHLLGWDATFTNQAAGLLRAIESGTAPSPSFEDGLAVQRVLEALQASAAQGSRAVDL